MFSQTMDLPTNPKTGECYIKSSNDSIMTEWKKIDCEFAKLIKDEKKLKTFQIKLHNLGYHVNMDGKLSDATIEAYHKYLKDEKKRKRKFRNKKKPNAKYKS